MDSSDPSDGANSGLLNDHSMFVVLGSGIIGFGLLVGFFDLLRKTIFVDASWNYNYRYFPTGVRYGAKASV